MSACLLCLAFAYSTALCLGEKFASTLYDPAHRRVTGRQAGMLTANARWVCALCGADAGLRCHCWLTLCVVMVGCPLQVLLGGGQDASQVTTTAAKAGGFEARFFHKVSIARSAHTHTQHTHQHTACMPRMIVATV